MTHIELENELCTLERKIEVLELLIGKPQCACFTKNDETFNQSNLKDLALYKERKKYLLKLKEKSSVELLSFPTHPIVKVYVA